MAVSFEISRADALEGSIEDLAYKAGVSVDFVAKDQMRLWINDIMKLSGPSTLTAGRAAVQSDLNRLFVPFDSKLIIDKWEQRSIDRGGDIFTTTKRGKKRVSKKMLKVKSMSDMAKTHKNNRRKKDGRVLLRDRRPAHAFSGEFIVPKPLYRRYLRETQQRVGLLKSRFGAAALHYARQTGGRTPAYKNWIKKHTAGGSFGGRMVFGNGFISATNDARYASEQMVDSRWWGATKHRRQRDIQRQSKKRIADIAKRFNAGAI